MIINLINRSYWEGVAIAVGANQQVFLSDMASLESNSRSRWNTAMERDTGSVVYV